MRHFIASTCLILMTLGHAAGQTLVDLKDQKLNWGEKTAGTQVALIADAARGPVTANTTVAFSVYVKNTNDSLLVVSTDEPHGITLHGVSFYTLDSNGKTIQISPRITSIFHLSFAFVPPESTYLFNVELPSEIVKLATNGLIAGVRVIPKTDNRATLVYSNKIFLPAN